MRTVGTAAAVTLIMLALAGCERERRDFRPGPPGAPVVNTIEFRDTGVILKVTPRVNANGEVLLDISQEVSNVVKTTTSDLDSPTIHQRRH